MGAHGDLSGVHLAHALTSGHNLPLTTGSARRDREPGSYSAALALEVQRPAQQPQEEVALDLSQLEPLGKVAGIGGIAIGAVVLLISGITDKTSSLPAQQRASTLRLLALGAFAIGALGIMAWVATGWSSGQQASTRGNDSPAIVSGGNATIGPAGSAGPSLPTPETGVVPNSTAKTEGDRSPAIISGGNATVSTPNNSSTPKAP
jgi:hypothetical protein